MGPCSGEISLVEEYERLRKCVISVCKGPKKTIWLFKKCFVLIKKKKKKKTNGVFTAVTWDAAF